MKTTRPIGICVIIMLHVMSTALLAQSSKANASGIVEVNGKTFNITSVQAKTAQNSMNDKKKDVMVLLSDQPVSETYFDRWNLEKLTKAGKLHAVLFFIEEDQTVGSMIIFPDLHITGGNVCKFECLWE
jgi:hypothetical protein